jgi:hypothetical protein
VHANRLRGPLHLEGAEVGEVEVARREPRRRLGHERLARLGELLHARREPHHSALRGVVHAQVVADLAHHDLARVDPHPHAEVEPALAPQLLREGAQRVAQVERRVARPLRVILVRDRRAE